MKNTMNTMKIRLVGMSFLQFAVWGAYLISMGTYLFSAGMGDKIGYFYAMQGVVALICIQVQNLICIKIYLVKLFLQEREYIM